MKFVSVSVLGFLFSLNGFAAGICDDPVGNTALCEKMSHLRSQILALDAQRELMQVNPAYMQALGGALSATSQDIVKHMGPGIPEHRQALTGVVKSAESLSEMATRSDPQMLVQANLIRVNCATCHQSGLNGRPSWEAVFGNDWEKISARCVAMGKNPYLCKSMNGMLSAFGYLFSGYRTDLQDFTMTAQAADEIARILEDLKAKNFNHLPDNLRDEALQAAKETSRLARARDTSAFAKGYSIMNACNQCHDEKFGPTDPASPRVPGALFGGRLMPAAWISRSR